MLNYILTQQHGKRIAVIENEFSSGLGIESMIAKNGMARAAMVHVAYHSLAKLVLIYRSRSV